MRKFFLIFFVICSILTSDVKSIYAQTFHFIMVADTTDSEIGENCKIDVSRMITFKDDVIAATGYKLNFIQILGNNFKSEKLLKRLASLQVQPTVDIVFFYYSGHGFSNRDIRFLVFGNSKNSDFVPIPDVEKIIEEKNPKLFISMIDNCGSVKKLKSNYNPISCFRIPDKDLVRLFSAFSGEINAVSSQYRQDSRGVPKYGSIFTFSFFEAICFEINKMDSPDWGSIFTKTKILTDKNSVELINFPQNPIIELNIIQE